MVLTYVRLSNDPALPSSPGGCAAQNHALSLYLIIRWPVLGSSHPPLPEEWWEDSFGGFQQPAAGRRQAAQGPPETEQSAPGSWLCRALHGLLASGFHSQSPQSLFWPRPESWGCWIEDFPEEGTGKNPQTILQTGKMSFWSFCWMQKSGLRSRVGLILTAC